MKKTPALRATALTVAAFLLFNTLGRAQEAPAAASPAPGETANAVRDLQDQVRQLRSLVDQMRAENAESRAEMHQLRQDLQSTRALLERPATSTGSGSEVAANSASGANSTSAAQGSVPLEERVQKLEESTSLIGSKIDEQYQTKVESASKYRARLHGIVLMNAFGNRRRLRQSRLPNYAQGVPPGWSKDNVGATLRQSEIGFEIFGPTIGGAKTSADVQLDFAGGFPATGNGVNFGIVRLQTASLRFDWAEHFRRGRPGFPVHLSSLAHLLRLTGYARLCLCRKPLGLDAAIASRAPLLALRPADT